MILDPESDLFYVKPILIKNILPPQDYQKLLEDIEELNISSDEESNAKQNEDVIQEAKEAKEAKEDQEQSLKDMTFIYVISNQVYAEQKLFKIGKHKGSKKKLIRRYKTYLIDPIVYYFFPTGSYYVDEQHLLHRFTNHRMGTSEYVHLELEQILETIQIYFRHKYERCPAVQVVYHGCIYQNKFIDFHEKKINHLKCDVYPNLDVSKANCLSSIDFKIEGRPLFHLEIFDIQKYLDNQTLFDFFKSFVFEFSKQSSVLFLNRFVEGGWNDLFVEWMKEMYDYSSYRILSRKEFLKKETFPERLLLITKDTEFLIPLDLVMQKVDFLKCCVVIEDQNCYSIDNACVVYENFFEKVFYFLFYCL